MQTSNPTLIRPLTAGDLADIKEIIDHTGLFPALMLDEMTANYFSDAGCEQIWLTAVADRPIGVAYCVPEVLTEGTWNTLMIAVHPDLQGQKIGAALIGAIEEKLSARGSVS